MKQDKTVYSIEIKWQLYNGKIASSS